MTDRPEETTMTEHTDNLDTTGQLPQPPEGYTRVVWVAAVLPVPPVITAVLTDEDAERVAAFIRARRVA